MAEKHSVTLVLTPSSVSFRQAPSPSGVSGSLMTTLSAIAASSLASRSIPSVSVATTSALTSPSTSAQISRIMSAKSRFSLAARLGLVVTPSSTPHRLISVISARLAVSRNSFTAGSGTGRPTRAVPRAWRRGRGVHRRTSRARRFVTRSICGKPEGFGDAEHGDPTGPTAGVPGGESPRRRRRGTAASYSPPWAPHAVLGDRAVTREPAAAVGTDHGSGEVDHGRVRLEAVPGRERVDLLELTSVDVADDRRDRRPGTRQPRVHPRRHGAR